MALINCPYCSRQIDGKAAFCSYCGNTIQNQYATPSAQYYQLPKKPWYKRVWVWLIIVFIGLPMLSGIIGGIAASEISTMSTETSSTNSVRSESSSESSKEESEESTAQNEIDEDLLKIIQYHKDKMNGTESEAALKGSETAFNLNLKLYKSDDDLKYRTYFYALKGEQEYINEFGEDRLEETRDYIKALDKENIMEKAFEEYAIEAEDKEKEFQESLIKVSAVELAKAYADNEVKANGLYKDKMLEVTGTVSSIGAGMFDSVYITLSDGNAYSLSEPQFSFQDNVQKEKVAELSKGDYVTIVGKCTGETLGKAGIIDCYFVE